jgi:hypothetical protein
LGADVLVLITCTNRKTVIPSPALRLRSVPGRTTAARAQAWIDRLSTADVERLPASRLYSGDHWHVVRSIGQDRQRHRVGLFVCSAGYGLVPVEANLAPYAATFALNHPDSVARSAKNGQASSAQRAWWEALAAWSGPVPGSPRSIADLACERKNSILLIAASPQYLDAVTDDLDRAAAAVGPERLAVFSAGADSHPTLAGHLVPCDARLQNALGGSLSSLNARCVRYALSHLGDDRLTFSSIRRLFSRLLNKQPEYEPTQRKALSDKEVCAFIRKALAADAGIRPTPLLRRLRDSDLACEQSRFTMLFRRVEGGRNG